MRWSLAFVTEASVSSIRRWPNDETHHNIGSRRRLLSPGSLTFVSPYRMHRGGRCADSRFYVINFHHRFLRPESSVDPLCFDTLPIERAPELAPFVYQEFVDFELEGEDLDVAHEACREMLEQSTQRRFFSIELIRASLLRLIGVVCQRYEGDLLRLAGAEVCRRERHDAVAQLVRHISAHLSQRIGLHDVAAALGMSPNNVTRLLKAHTGKTFTQLLTERRLQKAQELLTNTGMRIADIGEVVGFEDNAYFARRFKQYLRMSPRDYRTCREDSACLISPI
jgi:AraC-like DNA-binding protein